MKNIFKLVAFAALSVAAVSCSKSRAEQMKMAENIKIDCTPEVLALVGDKNIPADVAVTYPDGYFNPKAVMVVTPVLVYEGGEQQGESYIYQGEKVKDNNKVVPVAGGTLKEHFNFKYVPGMEQSHLELRSVVFYGNKRIEVPAIKVADGLNVTQLLACTGGDFSFKQDNYQAVIHETAEGQIMYDKNSAVVKAGELRSESIKELQGALEEIAKDPRYTIKGTQVVAYASPEGGESLNAKLSDKRASSAQDAWNKIDSTIPTSDLQVKSVGQDWEGFQEAVSNSNIEDKDLILRVLSMYSDPAVRESEIRNMSQIYTEINKKVFPELRRARFIADVDYQNFSDEELEQMSRQAVGLLDEEGLLRVAANSDNAERKAELYKTAVSKYGSDRANFNLAALALEAGKPEEAAKYLDAIKKSDADVLNAKGVCAMQQGDFAKAKTLFNQSGSTEANANLGTIALLSGNYAEAASKLAGTGSHNEAVAYLLNGQLDKAAAANNFDCAKKEYLAAIIAARKGDAAGVKSNLDAAAKKNPNFEKKAAKDVEFANFR